MRIDEGSTNRRADQQAEIGGRLGGKAGAKRRSRSDNILTDPRETINSEVFKADGPKIVDVPAPLMGEIESTCTSPCRLIAPGFP